VLPGFILIFSTIPVYNENWLIGTFKSVWSICFSLFLVKIERV